MKKRLFIYFALLLMIMPMSVFAAAGTEGREFWIALTIASAPEDKGTSLETFICFSSKSRKGTFTVTNPQTNFVQTYQIPTGTGWLKITDIPTSAGYPYTAGETQQQKASGKTFSTGLQLTSTEDVSVFAAIRYEYAFDASNILPITALQSEYIIQDYPPFANGSPSTSFSNFCVLATENNTEVEITPHAKTYDGKPANIPFKVTLNAGQVYYVVSEQSTENDKKGSDDSKVKTLSGSSVKALNGKKVAVFNGDICTRTPNHVSARDINYEQAMPVDYWGMEFIVTRSKEKDANRIRITAQEDDTDVSIDGYKVCTLNARETYEIELAVAADMQKYADNPAGQQIVGDVAYIKTSCPCAVYSYDTGNSYKSGSVSEIQSGYGDPSMTWVSPLEQNLSEITFGVMNTNKTTRHFVNIVIETANVGNIELREVTAGQFSNNMLTAADFQTVQSNTRYSYARKALSINANTTYNLHSSQGGFIAHVYGNGEDESYAYSAGSAAVKRGLQLGNQVFSNESVSDITYCVGDPIHFNAQVGTDIIDKATWDMGDGKKFHDGRIEFDYAYDSPGWYDIVANVAAHKVCPETTYPAEDVSVRIHVVIPDTVRRNFFICEGESFEYGGTTYTEATVDTAYFNCDSVVIFRLEVGKKTSFEMDSVAHDSCYWNGQWYYASGDYEWHGTNAAGCDSLVTIHLHILTCLDMDIHSPVASFCGDEPFVIFPYDYKKGDIGTTVLYVDGKEYAVEMSEGECIVDMQPFKPGKYTNARIVVSDPVCEQPLEFPVTFEVRYPVSVFAQKWDNVLAVYNKDYNGGYEFSAFQWYKNGEPIPGATGSWYHSDTPLSPSDTYSVLLTTTDGRTVLSCEKNAVDKSAGAAVSVSPNMVAPGEAVMVKTDASGNALLYNALGVKEMQTAVTDGAMLQMPQRTGVYVLQLQLEDGTTHSFRLIVR